MNTLAFDAAPAAWFVGTLFVLLAAIGLATLLVSGWVLLCAWYADRVESRDQRRWADLTRVLNGHTEADR